jgi:transcriptional regulator
MGSIIIVMYIPKHFEETNTATLHDTIQTYPFGILVTNTPNGVPFATHLPFLLIPSPNNPLGVLFGHLARASPQWQTLENAENVLAIFHGPHAYISPTWYAHQPAVPTWNYVAIHAYGTTRLLGDEEFSVRMDQLQAHYEPDSAPLAEDYRQKMLKGIVGFELTITKLEGKYKLSQNQPEKSQEGVRQHLESQGESEKAIATLMKT